MSSISPQQPPQAPSPPPSSGSSKTSGKGGSSGGTTDKTAKQQSLIASNSGDSDLGDLPSASKKIKDESVLYKTSSMLTQNLNVKSATQQNALNNLTEDAPDLNTFDSKQVDEPTPKMIQGLMSAFQTINQGGIPGPGMTGGKPSIPDSLDFLSDEPDLNAYEKGGATGVKKGEFIAGSDPSDTPATYGDGASSSNVTFYMSTSFFAVSMEKLGLDNTAAMRDQTNAATKLVAESQQASWKDAVTTLSQSIQSAEKKMTATLVTASTSTLSGAIQLTGAAYQTVSSKFRDGDLKSKRDAAGVDLKSKEDALPPLEQDAATKKTDMEADPENPDKIAASEEADKKVTDSKKQLKTAQNSYNSLAGQVTERQNIYGMQSRAWSEALAGITNGIGQMAAAPISMASDTDQAQAQALSSAKQVQDQLIQTEMKAVQAVGDNSQVYQMLSSVWQTLQAGTRW